MNNAVYNHNGEIVGYRCFCCRQIFDAMWGTTCNICRLVKEENKKETK